MKKLLYIARYPALAVLLLMLLAWTPVLAQTVVYQGQTTPLSVAPQPGDVYSWELYKEPTDPNFNFATETGETSPSFAEFVGGTNTGATVNVLWKQPGIYFFKVNAWNITGCTNNLRVGMVKVLPAVAKILEPAPICSGETCTLTVELSGYKDSEWEYTVEFAPESGGTASSTIVGKAISGPGESKITTYLQVVPDPLVTTVFRVLSVTNTPNSGVGFTNILPSKPVTLIVYPPPRSSDIYKYIP